MRSWPHVAPVMTHPSKGGKQQTDSAFVMCSEGVVSNISALWPQRVGSMEQGSCARRDHHLQWFWPRRNDADYTLLPCWQVRETCICPAPTHAPGLGFKWRQNKRAVQAATKLGRIDDWQSTCTQDLPGAIASRVRTFPSLFTPSCTPELAVRFSESRCTNKNMFSANPAQNNIAAGSRQLSSLLHIEAVARFTRTRIKRFGEGHSTAHPHSRVPQPLAQDMA